MRLDEVKERGEGRPAPALVATQYHEAFRAFGPAMLWHWRELDTPTIAQALAVAESLRSEGNLTSRALAARIEQACRAAV